MRTGSEPATARSALRARFWLSLWGLGWTALGTVAFALAGRPGWAAACAALWLVTTVDLAVIMRHIRQGPHYQPGRDVPPYQPPEDGPPYPGPPRHRPPGGRPYRRWPGPRHP